MKKFFLALFILALIPVLLTAEIRADSPKYQKVRKKMVSFQIRMRGVSDPKVLGAMTEVPRHSFVPAELVSQAYADHPLPIGQGQTISQPYIVALMTASLKLAGDERVLEIGTGSGYQAAILAKVAKEVYTIEIKEKLQNFSCRSLMRAHVIQLPLLRRFSVIHSVISSIVPACSKALAILIAFNLRPSGTCRSTLPGFFSLTRSTSFFICSSSFMSITDCMKTSYQGNMLLLLAGLI